MVNDIITDVNPQALYTLCYGPAEITEIVQQESQQKQELISNLKNNKSSCFIINHLPLFF